MYKEHPIFIPPEDDAVLWRYMDFTKFVSLLDTQTLFFTRADKLGDPFEGSYSKANVAMRPALYEGKIPESALQQMADFMKTSRLFTLISCWHEASYESAAMWRLYSREHDGIAIKTDFKSFAQSFTCDEDIYIGKVQYIDYDTTFIPENNTFSPYLYKRHSFEHENEIRAMTQNFPVHDGAINLAKGVYPPGDYYAVNLPVLIKEVMVAPYAEEWFIELVQSVAVRYDLTVPVRRSRLAESPTWG